MFAKQSEKEKAAKILKKLLKKHNDDLATVLLKIRKKKISPMSVIHAMAEVLSISIEEADRTLLNSEAFKDLKEGTLNIRETFNKVLSEGADDIVEEDGKTYSVFDLTKPEYDLDEKVNKLLPTRYQSFVDLPYFIKVAIRDARITTNVEKYVNGKITALNNRSILDIFNNETEDRAAELVLWLIGVQVNGGGG